MLFCGSGERFASLSLLRHVDVPALIVQDPLAPWFTGSPVCSGPAAIETMIREQLPRVRRLIFAGQSSGGHAALVFAHRFSSSLAIAVSPQTFDDCEVKGRIAFPKDFSINTTPRIVDVLEVFREASKAVRSTTCHVIVPYSEHTNPLQSLFWGDYLHWCRIAHLEHVHITVLNRSSHALLRGQGSGFARFLEAVLKEPAWTDHRVIRALIGKHLARPR